MVEPQGIHQDIAHQISLRRLRLLPSGNTCTAHPGRKQIVAQGIDHQAVDFLRHIDIKGARASHQMRQFQTPLLRDDSSSHRRSQVIHDNHHIHRVSIEEPIELPHHPTRNLIQALGVNAQIEIRPLHLEIVEERRLQCRIILTPCINQMTIQLPGLMDSSQKWRHLHEIRTRTGYDTDSFFHNNL